MSSLNEECFVISSPSMFGFSKQWLLRVHIVHLSVAQPILELSCMATGILKEIFKFEKKFK